MEGNGATRHAQIRSARRMWGRRFKGKLRRPRTPVAGLAHVRERAVAAPPQEQSEERRKCPSGSAVRLRPPLPARPHQLASGRDQHSCPGTAASAEIQTGLLLTALRGNRVNSKRQKITDAFASVAGAGNSLNDQLIDNGA